MIKSLPSIRMAYGGLGGAMDALSMVTFCEMIHFPGSSVVLLNSSKKRQPGGAPAGLGCGIGVLPDGSARTDSDAMPKMQTVTNRINRVNFALAFADIRKRLPS